MRKSKRSEENNISEHPDMLPVILTCPHNGDFIPVDVPKRENPDSSERFS